MGQSVKFGPLTAVRDGDCWRFTLSSPNEISLELPAAYEKELERNLTPLFDGRQEPAASPRRESRTPPIVMDLAGIPAISSRQLGALLALQKALRNRVARLPLANSSPGVRHLLSVTRTAQFFDLI